MLFVIFTTFLHFVRSSFQFEISIVTHLYGCSQERDRLLIVIPENEDVKIIDFLQMSPIRFCIRSINLNMYAKDYV